jgi:pimeloyl-ACP methyl ester carboxylesterase
LVFFEGFALDRVDVGEAVLRVRHGGSGPPVLLLHGHPRTHTTWHRVAPLLTGGGSTGGTGLGAAGLPAGVVADPRLAP